MLTTIIKISIIAYCMIIAATNLAKGKTFESFIELSKRMNWKINEVPCFILFEKTDSIPYEVIMIPIKNANGENIDSLFKSTLKDNLNTGSLVYFQSLRWGNANLLEEMQGANGIEGKARVSLWFKNNAPVKIIRGSFYFNVTTLPEGLLHPLNNSILLTFADGVNTEVSVADAPREMGYPFYFKVY